MERKWLDELSNGLKLAISEKFGIQSPDLESITASGQNSLTSGLKDFVLKNGSKEIESILLKQSGFAGSALQTNIVQKLSSDLMGKHSMQADKAKEMAGFASGFLVEKIISLFQNSGASKDINGICDFLGIDKNLLKMVNSPVGKMFGKFFG